MGKKLVDSQKPKGAKTKVILPKVATYARQSSEANKHSSSSDRQHVASLRGVSTNVALHTTRIAEVISGALPAKKRIGLKAALKEYDTIYMENCRALARSSEASENLYQASVKSKTLVVPQDMPNLLTHTPNPTEEFLRKVIFAYNHFERQTLVARLKHGREVALAKSPKKNQDGAPKLGGRDSYLQKLKLPRPKLLKIKAACAEKKKSKSKIGWGLLAKTLTGLMGLDAVIDRNTAKRIATEIVTMKM